MFRVKLAGLGGVMRGVGVVTVGDMGVMRRLLDIVGAVMFGGLPVMLGGLFMVLGRVLVMLGDAVLVGHGFLLGWRGGRPVSLRISQSRCNSDSVH
jgi:hypothetical protein